MANTLIDWIPLDALRATLAASSLAGVCVMFLLTALTGEFASRVLRLNRFTAMVIAGLGFSAAARALPAHVIPLVPARLDMGLEAATMILLFEVGQRVSFDWLDRNRWLIVISVAESAAVFGATYALARFLFGTDAVAAAVMAAICMASSPVMVAAVARGLGARGQVTARSLLLSTLSTVYAAMALQLILSGALVSGGFEERAVFEPLYQLAGSLVAGSAAAAVLGLFVRVVRADPVVQVVAVAAVAGLILVVSAPLHLSPVLSGLAFGLIARTTDRRRLAPLCSLSEAGAVLGIAYCVLTGALMRWPPSHGLLLAGVALVSVRLLARLLVHLALAAPSGLAPSKGVLVAGATSPLSGIALLFALQAERAHPALGGVAELARAVVLIMAVAGPMLVGVSLRLAREDVT